VSPLKLPRLSVIALLGFTLFGQTAAPAQAAPGDPIQITNYVITPVQSSVSEIPGQQIVTLQGTYTNVSSAKILEVNLSLAISKPIENRTVLGELISDASDTPNLNTSKISARLRNLAPGVTKSWQITFRGEQVFDASGVFAVGVIPDAPSYGPSAAIAVPWFFNSVIAPTKVVLAVPLTTLNASMANGKSSDTKQDLSEANRLSALLRSQGNTSISWLLDSSINEWANNLASNTDTAAAKELVAALATLPVGTAALPYAHPNFSALIRASKQAEAVEVIDATFQSSAGSQIYYTPVSGSADRNTVSFLNQQNIKTIISNESIHGSERVTTPAIVTSSSNQVLVFDLAASNCLSNLNNTKNDLFLTTSCLKAEIGMITAESPQIARLIIVQAPSDWGISAADLTKLLSQLNNHNWMQLIGLQDIAVQSANESFIAINKNAPHNFNRSLITRSNNLKLNTESVSALYDDPELAKSFTIARIRGYSDLWPTNAEATAYLERNSSLLNDYLTAITVEASKRITTSEADSQIPVTIVNDSDKDVSVSLELTSAATSRFSARPSGIIQVARGQRVTVPISITLIGAGVVSVNAQLIAPNGERFGAGKEIQISSAAYSQFARTLVLGAFGLLIALALSNYVKRRRKKRRISN
jgi:hypothetical protein